jgi:hypothetical protein
VFGNVTCVTERRRADAGTQLTVRLVRVRSLATMTPARNAVRPHDLADLR